MTTTDINKIAAEARTLLEWISKVNAKHDTLVADRNARVKPLLEKVHHTLTVLKQPVEGVTSWNAWAQKAGWSKRNLNFILNGRPSQKKKESTGNSSSRSSFLKRIAEAKAKLTEVQSQIDAYFNAPDGAEPETDISGLTASITPTIEPLFEEFLKLITPDGCETMRIGNSNWHVQAYGKKPAPILHIKHSARKALCHTRFVNRPRKGTVFAKASEEATCPDCIAIRDKVPVKGTLQEARERALAKEQEAQPEETSIKIKLTDSQMREAGVVITPLSNAKKLTRSARAVSFHASTYQEVGKELILALEQRVESLRVEADEQKKTLLTWTDKSPENVAAFTHQKRLLGAVRACEGAISRIINGGDDTEDNLYDWYEQHRDERLGISEPAQALAAAVDAAPVPYDKEAYARAETYGQKVCIIGSPENLKWHADLEYRRNNPVVDPNADDEFAGERD